MKNNFTRLIFSLLSFSLFGQTEPIQKVEFEPDPIMMDAYDFATGRMNDVKWMAKVTFQDGTKVGFEYKLSNAISLNIESSLFRAYSTLNNINFFSVNNTASLRYYMNHDEEIKNGLRGNNLNGRYFEFGTRLGLPLSFKVYENTFVGFGMQSRFLKRGLVDTGLKLEYFGRENALNLRTGFDIGFAFSQDYNLVEMEENKCAIVRCYDEQFYMLRIPVSRLLFLSWSKAGLQLAMRPTLELEHRLTRVSLSVNHEVAGIYELFNSTVDTVGSFEYLEASYRMGIRWNVGKKKRIIKGKTSNNLSGFYVGPSAEYGVAAGKNDSYKVRGAPFYSLGLQYGYQTRLLKKLYFNVKLGFMFRDYYNTSYDKTKELLDIKRINRRDILQLDTGTELFELIPIAGLIVGYAF